MATIKFCHCEQCKYCLRNHAHAKFNMRKVVRKFRHQTKMLIKAGRFDELPDTISAHYFG